ncbi:MAG: hypothetical protein J6I96_01045 [Oscillospiraceae bacterium]|nr:hypothetical protein [Oscillospiraceae bacterium]
MPLMLLVTAIFTLTSLNDKYAVSKCRYNGSELTFIMAAFTALFLTPMMFLPLPFIDRTFTLSPISVICVLMIALAKWLEFAMSAKILSEMSVFELKAWMGITLFISYFADLIMGAKQFEPIKLLLIALSAAGLVIIAADGRQKVNYRTILIPLILYISQSFFYGFAVKISEGHISSSIALWAGLIILAAVMIPSAKPLSIAKRSPEGTKGFLITAGIKCPNAVGLMGLNAIAAQSLTNYSFIMPMCLVAVFIVDMATRKDKLSGRRLIGSLLVMAGIVGFQI